MSRFDVTKPPTSSRAAAAELMGIGKEERNLGRKEESKLGSLEESNLGKKEESNLGTLEGSKEENKKVNLEESKISSKEERKKGRKQVSMDMDPDLHYELKMQALRESKQIYILVEEAVKKLLEERKGK